MAAMATSRRRGQRFWTNPSVLAFAGEHDPMEVVVEKARTLTLEAMQEGWAGPPFSPFELAERLGVQVVAHEDLRDARLLADEDGRPLLEYNPTRPRGRLRFSIAHELAHTFFPDFGEASRYRSGPTAAPDAWQLELLCDVAAAELLMPLGSFPELEDAPLQIERLMEMRRVFEVSMEALLLRIAKLTPRAAAVFAASRLDGDDPSSDFRIDYVVPSRVGWSSGLIHGQRLSSSSPAGDCTAIGYTAKGKFDFGEGPVRIECAGIPPYPGATLPRVVGLVTPRSPVAEAPEIEEVYGDATQPRGTGMRMIVHLVNDRTPNWGGRFAKALKEAYPLTQRDFREWVADDRRRLRLGSVRFLEVMPNLQVATMVAQHGYGRSDEPLVRYAVLRDCLLEIARTAKQLNATVHMPRIGSGGGGGDWRIVRELIRETLVASGVPVTVYAPPETKPRESAQQMLPLN
jgi:Zn-dependent peptidase ImmA (M78 family)/O-acetyl-ADP-ribose deacetylase (regulator of RNase III)